jgi:hypothetical protein
MYRNGNFFVVEPENQNTELMNIHGITHYKIITKPRG